MTRITLTNAEHNRLQALGDATVRRIVSETTDQIGLGRFVPVDPDDPNTDWFTAHPDNQNNARQALPILADRLRFAVRQSNATKIRALVKDVDGTDTIPPITRADRAARWRAAGGDDAPIELGQR